MVFYDFDCVAETVVVVYQLSLASMGHVIHSLAGHELTETARWVKSEKASDIFAKQRAKTKSKQMEECKNADAKKWDILRDIAEEERLENLERKETITNTWDIRQDNDKEEMLDSLDSSKPSVLEVE